MTKPSSKPSAERMRKQRAERRKRGWEQYTVWLHRADAPHFLKSMNDRNKERGL